MATIRGKKNLSCFYCGRKSNLRFDGRPSFDCAHCDATNWLDEHGSITDPPIASLTSDQAPDVPIQYAIPRSSGVHTLTTALPPDAFRSPDSIFCTKCLQNQDHLARTLREFEFPDDPDGPEYAARVKSYRKWRKDIEERYPQMCAECEPRVQEQLQKAGYTAKTDHLKRMMDRTRAQRQQVKKRGPLEILDAVGKWTWNFAFILQFAWHASVLCAIFVRQERQGDVEHWAIFSLREACKSVLELSPSSSQLIWWAISLGLAAFAWNPRFKQTIRGFTSHILGLRQWYTYQLVILLIRCTCLLMSQYNDFRSIPAMTQLSAHLVISSLMVYVFKVAGNSIRTDTTPLFGSSQPVQGIRQPSPRASHQLEPQTDPNDLGGVLDEIMKSPPTRNANTESPSDLGLGTHESRGTRSSLHNGSFGVPIGQNQRGVGFGSLNLSRAAAFGHPEPQPVQDDDEMDWSPSSSQHRAFSTHNPYKIKNPNPRFSDAPIEAKPGPFWYKVPPAPITPAQKLRNPPMKPIIRESPKENKEPFFQSSKRGPVNIGTVSQSSKSEILFKNPQFYAPAPKNDPRDGLSNMMGSFSISPSPDGNATRATMSRIDGGLFSANRTPGEVQNHGKARTAELIILFGALWAWVTALSTKEPYGPTLALGSICVCFLVSVRLAAALYIDAQVRNGKQPSVFRLSWANLGLAQVIAATVLGWKVWIEKGDSGTYGVYGNALLYVMIGHQVWHVFG